MQDSNNLTLECELQDEELCRVIDSYLHNLTLECESQDAELCWEIYSSFHNLTLECKSQDTEACRVIYSIFNLTWECEPQDAELWWGRYVHYYCVLAPGTTGKCVASWCVKTTRHCILWLTAIHKEQATHISLFSR